MSYLSDEEHEGHDYDGPDTCHECNEVAVGVDANGTPCCALHYRSRPAFWDESTSEESK